MEICCKHVKMKETMKTLLAQFRKSEYWILAFLILMVMGCATSSPEMAKKTAAIPVGVVDTQWLLEQSKLGKQVSESLNKFMKDRQALLELEQKELRSLESQLLRQGSVLSAAAKQQREEQFRRRMLAYQQKVADMNREVQGKQAELFSEFRDAVDIIVEKIARQNGLSLVVEKGQNTPTRYYEPTLDISQEILNELDQQRSK